MNRLVLPACALLLLILGTMMTSSMAQTGRRQRANRRGGFGPFRFAEKRREQEDTENRRACFVMGGLFTRRECMAKTENNAICRMLAFLIKNGDYDCEQFPCSGYGENTRSVCVTKGTCSRLTLSNGLCTNESECCIEAND